jgi:tetratricopeptide (TPR) repeat protein
VIRTLGAYQNQGKLDKAFEFYEKALVIKIKVLGEEHPSVALSYNNLGLV